MQRLLLLATLPPMLLFAACKEDVGSCPDAPDGGPDNPARAAVLGAGGIMYEGQAIVTAACATGCHNSTATGDARNGAPKGLDFDLLPVRPLGGAEGDAGVAMPDMAADGGTGASTGIIAANSDDLDSLRSRQRKVFEERNNIWSQIQDGLMPPDGVGQGFRDSSPGSFFTVDTGTGKCTRGEDLAPFKDASTKERLRIWLACGAPIVELNSPELTLPQGGVIGDQWPTCELSTENVTFETVYEEVFQTCVACHAAGSGQPTDFYLAPPDVAYQALLGADGQGGPTSCPSNPSPMVKPNDPENSYLFAKVKGVDAEICGDPMPLGFPNGLQGDPKLDVLRAWIEAGAPGPAQ